MNLTFGDALTKCGLARSDVRLLRHQAKSPSGRTPYLLWRDQRTAFDEYQSVQSDANRAKLAAPFWASFVVPANGGTLFSGLYLAERIGPEASDWVDPLYERPGSELTTSQLDRYRVTPSPLLASYVGKLWIEWGAGTRSWIQRADNQDKAIVQLTREFREDAFPGYDRFIANVSDVATLPLGWVAALRAARGVYLLTSARTKEQYVGSATGDGGFYARWLNYASDGHGGNIGLKSADPSDYQIAILEWPATNRFFSSKACGSGSCKVASWASIGTEGRALKMVSASPPHPRRMRGALAFARWQATAPGRRRPLREVSPPLRSRSRGLPHGRRRSARPAPP